MRTDAVWANTRCAMLWYLCLMDKPLGCTWIGQYIYAHEIFVKSNLKIAQEKQTNKQCSWSRRRPLKYQRIQTEHFLQRLQGKGFSLELKRMLLAIKLPELLRINDKCRKLNSTIFKFSLFKDDAPSAAKLNKSMMNTAKLDKECGQTLVVCKAECSLVWIPKMQLRIRTPPILVKGQ